MSNASEGFAKAMADVTAAVQGDAEAAAAQRVGVSTTPNSTTAGPQGDPAAAGAQGQPTLIDGKFKTEEERQKAHHLLIANLNAEKAKNDDAAAKLAAAEARIAALEAGQAAPPAPLSPGRVDPTVARTPLAEKFVTQYGIDPADLQEFTRGVVNEALEQVNAPTRAMQAAEAYIIKTYPDFPERVKDITAFVSASPVVDARVRELYSKGLYAEAMEIGYLAYDNALRAVSIVASQNAQTQAQIEDQRNTGSMISSQAAGPRETQPSPNSFPVTQADWAEVRAMKEAGQDNAVRARLFGPLIAHIPALNGGRTR